MRLGRRSLLAALPVAIATSRAMRTGLGVRDWDIIRLLAMLGDPAKALVIGEGCLKSLGNASVPEIARGLPVEINDFRHRVRKDFAAGRLIVADGWVLSQSEARLYALAVLFSRTS